MTKVRFARDRRDLLLNQYLAPVERPASALRAMSEKEMAESSAQGGLGFQFPLELIEAIVENNRGDKVSLLASSCVLKSWCAASQRYLFTANFSSDDDFTRWREIGSHLPQVPIFVKEVVFAPGRRSEMETPFHQYCHLHPHLVPYYLLLRGQCLRLQR